MADVRSAYQACGRYHDGERGRTVLGGRAGAPELGTPAISRTWKYPRTGQTAA